jgi:hypothetical protein
MKILLHKFLKKGIPEDLKVLSKLIILMIFKLRLGTELLNLALQNIKSEREFDNRKNMGKREQKRSVHETIICDQPFKYIKIRIVKR